MQGTITYSVDIRTQRKCDNTKYNFKIIPVEQKKKSNAACGPLCINFFKAIRNKRCRGINMFSRKACKTKQKNLHHRVE